MHAPSTSSYSEAVAKPFRKSYKHYSTHQWMMWSWHLPYPMILRCQDTRVCKTFFSILYQRKGNYFLFILQFLPISSLWYHNGALGVTLFIKFNIHVECITKDYSGNIEQKHLPIYWGWVSTVTVFNSGVWDELKPGTWNNGTAE